ncbi:MAG: thymidylate kinase [Chthoniobacterales bacterium]
MKKFVQKPLPEVQLEDIKGRLFVIEGIDGSGRSTQIALLSEWLESKGYAVKTMGIKRSNLVSEELDAAKRTTILTRTTMSLFYATDFFDQLINEIIPALRAGYVVLADRYIYTLMARDLVRGTDPDWVNNLYSTAVVPDAVFFLKVGLTNLVARNFEKNKQLEYWESGMDLGLSRDIFDSFVKYQKLLQTEFSKIAARNHFTVVNGNRTVAGIQSEMRRQLAQRLDLK